MQKLINIGAFLVATICLAVTFVAAGLLACAGTPAPTRMLAEAFVTEDVSPYNHDELAEMAVEIRDYSFGNHDLAALNNKMTEVFDSAVKDGRALPGQRTEEYRLDQAAISHLDDCYKLLDTVRIPLIAIAVLAIAAAAHVGVRMGRRNLGRLLTTTGALLIIAFAALGIAALIDFDGFFGQFHQLFFPQGNWTFWYKSLLICSLPEEFWMGMGVIWFATTALLSILSFCVGNRLRKTKHRGNPSQRGKTADSNR